MRTALFCRAIAFGFTLLGLAFDAAGGGSGWAPLAARLHSPGVNLVVSLVIDDPIERLFLALIPLSGAQRVRRFTRRPRALCFIAGPLTGR